VENFEDKEKLAREIAICLKQSPSEHEKARNLLGLDETNWDYFLSLYRAYTGPRPAQAISIRVNKETKLEGPVAISTALASKEEMKDLPHREYVEINQIPKYAAASKKAAVWMKKMQAGTGSSVLRKKHVSESLGIPLEQVREGAKGTDLFVKISGSDGKTILVPLAELQIRQLILAQKREEFGAVIFHDIVSSETLDAVEKIWASPSLSFESSPYIQRGGRTLQGLIPTLDEEGNVSLNRLAPGGHALFGLDSLRAALSEKTIPRIPGFSTIGAIGNGEDLSSTPDKYIVGWMIEEKIPIAMVTTEKTELDMKGGQLMLVRNPKGSTYVMLLETAQAKAAGQLELFENLGLRPNDGKAFFNTNIALFNYDILAPILLKLREDIGEAELSQIIAPDLILNKKEKYTQLEGALGSSLLNLDRFWREKYGEPLVQFINIDREHRTDFFSPIKTAFDFFLQFSSDRFTLDETRMRLINHRPGKLPSVSLTDPETKDKYWADVSNVQKAFRETSVINLQSLKVKGQADFSGQSLSGDVHVGW
jgi:hypothetical protein